VDGWHRNIEKEEIMVHVRGNVRRSVQLVCGILAALAVIVVCSIGAQARADGVSPHVIQQADTCESQTASDLDGAVAASDDVEALGACENSCHFTWDLLVDECFELVGSARGECLDEAQEYHETCLANCP
jgi:hypothetical protein